MSHKESQIQYTLPTTVYGLSSAERTPDSSPRPRVRDLLTHSSGLPSWAPLYREVRGKEEVVSRIMAMELDYGPGTKSVYSDLGMILLGEIIERVSEETLDEFSEKRVFEPLGMRDTRYRPDRSLWSCIAPTEECQWRRRLMLGEVQDENAYVMGGVAGHAGLFGTAPDLARFCRMMLNRGELDGRRIVKAETVDLFTRLCGVPGSSRTLGWETPAGDEWTGMLWSEKSYGHTGLTGTMIWIDPEHDVFLVLLTNSIHPQRGNESFCRVRRDVANLLMSLNRSKLGASQ